MYVLAVRRFVDFLRQFGLDPLRAWRAFTGTGKFVRDLYRFLVLSKFTRLSITPILTDFDDSAGTATGHYFWQDLICAQWIFDSNPVNHLDIGSRIDGFVAHLLSFREVTLMDIRQLQSSVPRLTIVYGDAQKELTQLENSFDSVSSLHAIEHFGLGRYGDTIDPKGHLKGLINIARTVSLGGHLYLSFPIGESKIEFNAQRVIAPETPINLLSNFVLEEFVLIPWKGLPQRNLDPRKLQDIGWGYAGLYKFKKMDL